MDKYTETLETWNKIANLYQEKFMNLALYNHTYDVICDAIVVRNAKLLEIGCGPGNISKYLLTKRPDFEIMGIDSAPQMIELAKSNNPSASFLVMDARKIDELRVKFDGIICGFVIPYLSIEESKRLIRHSHKLLNANGLLYLSFVEGDPADSEFKVGNNGNRVFFNYHKAAKLVDDLRSCEFENINILRVPYSMGKEPYEFHTVIIATKPLA